MILNVNKPKNYTSFDVVAKIRAGLKKQRQTKKVKVGHAGTLDPLATGVLIVLTDQDTKRQNEFMNLKKTYEAQILIGAHSKTYDLEGELKLCDNLLSLDEVTKKLPKALELFEKSIVQTVPAFSAIKVKGKRLYKTARSGVVIDDLPKREVYVHDISILNTTEVFVLDINRSLPLVTLKIVCSKGTYIRSIANDLGKALNSCGVLYNLVRTSIGEYTVEDSYDIDDVLSQFAQS